MSWKKLEEHTPVEGNVYGLLISAAEKKNADRPKSDWETNIGTYNDGEFYSLQYDPHLGVVRKDIVHGKVKAFCTPELPDWRNEL